MNTMLKNKTLTGIMILIISIFSSAQTGGIYNVDKSTIDAGGGRSDGGVYILEGSIGQQDANKESTGGSFSLTGGFWSQGLRPDFLFKDGFEN